MELNESTQVKQPYEKPALRTIELVAEEVLAAGCKVLGHNSAGPLLDQCTTTACAALDIS